MQQRTIGGRSVSAIGLGGMPMSIEGRPDPERSIATIHAALDAGVTLIDTADSYHRDANEVGHNEELIARALREYGAAGADVLVATKGGHLRPGDGTWTRNGDPAYLKRAAKESARRLGVDAIGHFAFFHSRFTDTLWPVALYWLQHGALPADAPGAVHALHPASRGRVTGSGVPGRAANG